MKYSSEGLSRNQALNAAAALMIDLDPDLSTVQTLAADVNLDTSVTVRDAQYILVYAANTMSEIETNWRELTGNPNMPDTSNLS